MSKISELLVYMEHAPLVMPEDTASSYARRLLDAVALQERATDTVYHATSYKALYWIGQSDTFNLSSTGASLEVDVDTHGRKFYMSTARRPDNSYQQRHE